MAELPALPEAAQSRLRFSLTELRAEVEAKEDLWPGSKVQSTEVCFFFFRVFFCSSFFEGGWWWVWLEFQNGWFFWKL